MRNFPYSQYLFLLLAGTVGLHAQTVSVPPPTAYYGEAYDLKTHEKVYTEYYQDNFTSFHKTGTYTRFEDPHGKPIVERHLDFSKSDEKPDYTFKDFRNGYEEGAQVSGNQVRMYFKESRNTALKEKSLTVPEPFVIDGGFNSFLKGNWEKLAVGEHIHFHFVAPARLDYYGFVAHEDPARVPKGKVAMAIVVELDNVLLRLLVSPIVILYDSSSRRMIEYQGISNINDAQGKSLKVRLIYPEMGP